jgi:hypothetical protein
MIGLNVKNKPIFIEKMNELSDRWDRERKMRNIGKEIKVECGNCGNFVKNRCIKQFPFKVNKSIKRYEPQNVLNCDYRSLS